MADYERKVKPAVKRRLIDEAGGKCANPGCTNWRTHLHHIKQWAVYRSHDGDEMIAVCPSCHDEIHHGRLPPTDETLHAWKGIVRPPKPSVAHIYVEPATNAELKLLAGSISLATANRDQIVFELSGRNALAFRIVDDDILQVSLKLHDQKGGEVLRIVENHVRVNNDKAVQSDFMPGHVRISVPVTEDYVPAWVVDRMRTQEAKFAKRDKIPVLELEVVKPGVVRVQGIWVERDNAIVITRSSIAFCSVAKSEPISLVGHGEDTVLRFMGPLTSAMFGFK